MRHSLAMNSRNTIPFLLFLVLGALLFSPVSAYTIGDDICSETENILHVWDFDTLPDSIGIYGGTPTFLVNESVDNSYHHDINGTAWRFAGYGGNLDGFQISIYGFDNSSVGFDINTIYMDLFNYSFSNVLTTEFILYYSNYSENIQYTLVYAPLFDTTDNTEDYSNVKYVADEDSYWWRTWIGNYTEIDNYFTAENPRDWEMRNFDFMLWNIPPDYRQIVDIGNWDLDFAVDNVKVAYEENEYLSQDCSVSYENIDDIGIYYHWINIEATNIFMMNGEDLGNMQMHFSVLPDYPYNNFYGDGGNRIIIGNTNLYEQWYLNGVNGSHHENAVINISCYFYPTWDQNPLYYNCGDIIENNYRTATGQEISNIENSATILNDYEVVGDTYGIIKLENYDLTDGGTRFKINDSYWLIDSSGTPIRHKAYYCDLGYSDCDHVNNTWDMVSNFTTTRYYIHSETTEIAENISWANNIYINPDNENLIDNIGKDIIVRGYVLKNVNHTNVGNYLTEAYLTIGTENYNIIGDDICGDLESYISSDWNYDEQCEYDIYGLTGYAVTQTNILVAGVVIVMFLLGSILILLSNAGWDVKATMIFFLIAIAIVAGAILSNYP